MDAAIAAKGQKSECAVALPAQVHAVANKLDELLALGLRCPRRQALKFHLRQSTLSP